MQRILVGAVAIWGFLAGPAAAGSVCVGGGEKFLGCTLRGGAKTVSVCLDGLTARYRFGPTGGKPELALDRHVKEVGYRPWPGVGRSIWEEVRFVNRAVTYTVWYSVDRMVEGSPVEAGIVVSEGGRELARLECDRGSVGGVLYGEELIGDAKRAAGQEWCLQDQTWQTSCR